MIEFGKELRAAREAKGLTTADIARQTHMMAVMAEDLENENFSRIVAPIYGRGFVKLYCEAVGLDPKPYIAEFMDIYTGNRDPAIRERPTAKSIVTEPEPAPVPEVVSEVAPEAPAPAPEAPAPKPAPQPTLFDPPSAWKPPEPKRAPVAPLTPEPEAPAANRLSRYSSPFQDRLKDFPDLVPTLLRWGVVALVALLLLWGVIAGIRALYRATSSANEPTATLTEDPFSDETPSPSVPAAETSAPAEPTPRTPIAIPPLYID